MSPRPSRDKIVSAVRSAAWRVLGTGPAPAAAVAGDGVAAPSAAAQGLRPLRELRKAGLRAESGLQVFAAKEIKVSFEPPAQLNNTVLYAYRPIQIGRYSYLRSGTIRHVDSIGRYTSIGPGVILGEAEHPTDWLSSSPAVFQADRYTFYPPEADAVDRVIIRSDANTDPTTRKLLTIGNDVWIGANVMVRRGISIGDGAIVGSGAFVNKDVAPYTIVGGLPARELGMRFEPELVQRLQHLRWWDFDVSDLAGVDFADVPAALDEIERREASGQISRIPVEYSTVVLANGGYRSLKIHPAHRDKAQRRLAARRG